MRQVWHSGGFGLAMPRSGGPVRRRPASVALLLCALLTSADAAAPLAADPAATAAESASASGAASAAPATSTAAAAGAPPALAATAPVLPHAAAAAVLAEEAVAPAAPAEAPLASTAAATELASAAGGATLAAKVAELRRREASLEKTAVLDAAGSPAVSALGAAHVVLESGESVNQSFAEVSAAGVLVRPHAVHGVPSQQAEAGAPPRRQRLVREEARALTRDSASVAGGAAASLLERASASPLLFGPSGESGPQGTTGAEGPAGPQGKKGAVGEASEKGPDGPRGATGHTGLAGPDGEKGDIGPTSPPPSPPSDLVQTTMVISLLVVNVAVVGAVYVALQGAIDRKYSANAKASVAAGGEDWAGDEQEES